MFLNPLNYREKYGDKQLYINDKNVTDRCYKAIKVFCIGVALCVVRDQNREIVTEDNEIVREIKFGLLRIR